MYQTKEEGLGGYRVFEPVMYEQALWRASWRTSSKAIERDELRVHYQPVVLLKIARIVGIEALLRWGLSAARCSQSSSPRRRPNTPLRRALGAAGSMPPCRQARAFPSDPPLMIGVNLCASSRSRMRGRHGRILRKPELDPGNLALESPRASRCTTWTPPSARTRKLKVPGVNVDDFGTGNSSALPHQPVQDGPSKGRWLVRPRSWKIDNPAIVPGLIDFAPWA